MTSFTILNILVNYGNLFTEAEISPVLICEMESYIFSSTKVQASAGIARDQLKVVIILE